MDDLADWTDLGALTRRCDYLDLLRNCPSVHEKPMAAQQLADALDAVVNARDAVIARIASRAGIGATT